MNRANDMRSLECSDITNQVNSLEMHQQNSVRRYEDLNNILHHKTNDVQEHEAKLAQCESEINTLNG